MSAIALDLLLSFNALYLTAWFSAVCVERVKRTDGGAVGGAGAWAVLSQHAPDGGESIYSIRISLIRWLVHLMLAYTADVECQGATAKRKR